LSDHREAIALLTAMIQQTLDDDEDGDTNKLWRELSRTWRRAEAARLAREKSRWREAYHKLGVLIERGGAQVDREAELLTLLERRRKQVESETKRRLAEANTFTREEAAAFYTGLGASVRRHLLDPNLTDEEKIRAIEDDVAKITGEVGLPQPAWPGSE
jgi:hypothetical protein